LGSTSTKSYGCWCKEISHGPFVTSYYYSFHFFSIYPFFITENMSRSSRIIEQY
jgi:hypothetical protein